MKEVIGVGGRICRGRFEHEGLGIELVGQGTEKVRGREGVGIELIWQNLYKGWMLELVGGIICGGAG